MGTQVEVVYQFINFTETLIFAICYNFIYYSLQQYFIAPKSIKTIKF